MKTTKQKGVAAVEFVLILPLLLLLVVSLSELSVMFYRLNAVTKAVDTAARYLSDVSVNKANTSDNLTIAKNLVVYGEPKPTAGVAIEPGLTTSNITISNPDSDHVKVTVSYDANLILIGALNRLMIYSGSSAATQLMTLQASSVMRFAQ